MTLEVIGEGWDRADFERRFEPVLKRMTENRGWIVNSYAQLEFLAADLIQKVSTLAGYEEFARLPLPFGIDRRVKRLRELCQAGPLAAHADHIMPLMERLLELEETRHFFTHGFCSIHIAPDGSRMALHFRRFVPPVKGGIATRGERIVLPEDMDIERSRCTIFAQTAVGIFRDVYEALGLDSHDVTDGAPERIGPRAG